MMIEFSGLLFARSSIPFKPPSSPSQKLRKADSSPRYNSPRSPFRPTYRADFSSTADTPETPDTPLLTCAYSIPLIGSAFIPVPPSNEHPRTIFRPQFPFPNASRIAEEPPASFPSQSIRSSLAPFLLCDRLHAICLNHVSWSLNFHPVSRPAKRSPSSRLLLTDTRMNSIIRSFFPIPLQLLTRQSFARSVVVLYSLFHFIIFLSLR